jgi:ABC-type branched-subunit amino acid transport system ATPase component
VNAAREVTVRLEDVHTFYGSIPALKGISLEVREGEIVTLIGANGAGKSTTLRSINGLNTPREGKIVFQGKDITRSAPHDIVELGISQSPDGRRLFPRMTVLETSSWAPSSAATARASRRTSSGSIRCSRGSTSVRARRRGPSPVASSRWPRSAGR